MKKMIVFAATVVAAVMSQAAQLDWEYAASSADVGKSVYVLIGSTAVESWESLDALTKAAVDNSTIAKVGRTGYAASGIAVSPSITTDSASLYYVIVDASKETFSVTSVSDMTGSVYDPAAQQSTPGKNGSLSPASITKSGLAWGGGSDPVVPTPTPIDPSGVPEPTSGLLLLVGGAALALRRKQK